MKSSTPSDPKIKPADLLFYAITDRRWSNGRTLLEQAEDALRGGITCLQYREKEYSRTACLEEGRALRALCLRYQVPFIVNDHPDLALELDADGVHLGANDGDIAAARRYLGPDRIIGGSARTIEAARLAERAGADYLGCGAVFATATKDDTLPLEHGLLKQICASVHIPIVAIGGIGPDNLNQLKGLGLAGIALVSAVFDAADVQARCAQLLPAIRQTIL